MSVDPFVRQLKTMYLRLSQLYEEANQLPEGTHPEMPLFVPKAFRELGTASEELQVALEELQQQNEELAAARQMVEAQRRRYQNLFEFAPDGYLVTDAAGMIQEANQTAAELLNVPQEFLVGKPLINYLSRQDQQGMRLALTQLQQVKRLQEYEVLLQPRHGQPFNAALTVTADRSPADDSSPRQLRWLVRDITQRKQTAALGLGDDDPSQDRPRQTFYKGETIPLEAQTVWLVYEGLVKLTTFAEREEVLVGLVGPNRPFGMGLTSLSTYQAVALTKVQLVSVPLAEIVNSPHLAQALLPQLNQRLQQAEALLAVFGHRQVRERLHHLLRLLKQEIGQSVPQGTRLGVRLTHADLANACCTTRVTMTRLLQTLQHQGKLSFDGDRHIILKDDAL